MGNIVAEHAIAEHRGELSVKGKKSFIYGIEGTTPTFLTTQTKGSQQPLDVIILDDSGNQVTSFGGAGGTSHGDDSAFTIASASSITPVGYLADETAPDSVDEGDVGVARMTLSRKPYAVITDPTSENNAGVDGSGHLQVDIAADSAGIGGGTQYTEDVATADPIVGTAGMMERDDALSALTPIEGDWAAYRCNARGALWVELDLTNDVTIADGGNTITVDGTITANLSATDNAVLDTIDAVLDAIKIDTEAIETAVEGTLTVSGTVTANLSATDNAVLDQIELNTDPLLVVGGGTEATAIRVTLANNSTGVVSVDDNGGDISIDDGGNTITVDGTITANLSATDNAVLDTIDAVLDTINAKLVTGTVIGDVNLGATDNAVLDTIDAVLDTIKVDTEAIETAVELIDDAISGSEMQVDIVSQPKASSANASTKVSVGSTDTVVLASNASRKVAIVVNDSDEDVYLNMSATAVMNEGVRINANGGSFTTDTYTGEISGICSSGSKNVTVTEL